MLHILSVLSLLLLAGTSAAAPSPNSHSPKVLSVGFEVKTDPNFTLPKRHLSSSLTVSNAKYIYYANLTVGSNNQILKVMLDTGSSDLWFPSISLSSPESPKDGFYDPSASTSSESLGTLFKIGYLDGSSEQGEFYTDEMLFEGSGKPFRLQFGVVTNSSDDGNGVLGLGPIKGEMVNKYGGPQYPNFPLALVKAGIIRQPVYSVYLNSATAKSGTVLFGGRDEAKYEGQLVKIESTNKTDHFLPFMLHSISVSSNNEHYDLNIPCILDTGATISYIPQEFADKIISDLGGDPITGRIDCNITGNLTFSFKGVDIEVPIDEFAPKNADGDCMMNLYNSLTPTVTLGDNFLRRAYALFDLRDKSVSLAQAKYTDKSKIKEYF